MANQEHLALLKQGTTVWNEWRAQHPTTLPDLSEANLYSADLRGTDLSYASLSYADLSYASLSYADLSYADLSYASLSYASLSYADLREANLNHANLNHADLSYANLSKADLSKANLSKANLSKANFSKANLSGANLSKANLSGANLSGANLYSADLSEADLSEAYLNYANLSKANLSEADLSGANLSKADLSKADLSKADLSKADLSKANLSEADLSGANLNRANLGRAILVRTKLEGATLTECRIYGISAWDIELTGATQDSLVITPYDQPTITVDNLKIAQFIYLLLNNQEIRDVINTITTKVVLILGRFTPERKTVLDALRNILRTKDYVPIIFDFDQPASKDTHETITTLARLARFVIADITEAKSIPQELVSIVESLPSLTIQPLLQRDSEPWGMYDHIKRYPWVLPIHRYIDLPDLLATLEERVIGPAERKAQELTRPS